MTTFSDLPIGLDETPVQFIVGFRPLLGSCVASTSSASHRRVNNSTWIPPTTCRCFADAAGSLNDGFSSLLLISPLE
ncbi:hypothetical protein HAX54_012732, partial [Datura stramonium]|nr:hypothetical protein [Datura stramonium]